MDTAVHNMHTLFQQLGLPADEADIEQFISEHSLPADQSLSEGEFWSEAQSHFLREAINEDADWAEVVDELDACLHDQPLGHNLHGHQAWLRESASQYLPEPIAY